MKDRGAERRRRDPSVQFPLRLDPEQIVAAERRCHGDRRTHGYISELQIFAGVPYHRIEDILTACPVREFDAVEVVLRPGQSNEHVHIVLAGELRVHLDAHDSSDYIPIRVGECIGEMSIIDGKPVSAFVVAQPGTKVLLLHAEVFWSRIVLIPGVAKNLLGVLAERMRRNNETILERLKEHLMLEQMQRELEVARELQASMLPSTLAFPGHDRISCHAFMHPARAVGGDFFDGFLIGDRELFVAVGDVSGKGVPAALLMTRAMTLLRTEAARGQPVETVLSTVNDSLCQGGETGLFVTLFCALLDIDSGRLRYANAGHNPPLLRLPDGRLQALAEPAGVVAGVICPAAYEGGERELAPGTLLLLYTDGVTEARDARRQFYGEERLKAALMGAEDGPAQQVVDALIQSLAEFVGEAPQSDDITLLALRYHGAAADGGV